MVPLAFPSGRSESKSLCGGIEAAEAVYIVLGNQFRETLIGAPFKMPKRISNTARENWGWQPGGFDRLLRTSESVHEKWNYIRENPVRAGLVAHRKHWPYQRGFSADE